MLFASSSIGGIPIPPPIRKAFFPGSTVNPFPSGPSTRIVSPAFNRENSSVPVPSPVTRYTRRSVPASASIPHRLIGRGSSLLASLLSCLCMSCNMLRLDCHVIDIFSDALLLQHRNIFLKFFAHKIQLSPFCKITTLFLSLCKCSGYVCDHIFDCQTGGICEVLRCNSLLFILILFVSTDDTTGRVYNCS